MGRRRFYYQLVSPTTDTSWLRNEYKHISYILESSIYEDIDIIRKSLHQLRDIEKYADNCPLNACIRHRFIIW